MNQSIKKLLFLLADVLIITFSFFVVSYLRREQLHLDAKYVDLLYRINFLVVTISLYFRKYSKLLTTDYLQSVSAILKTILISFYFLAFWLVFIELHDLSRGQTFYTFTLVLCCELSLLTFYYWFKTGGILFRWPSSIRQHSFKLHFSLFRLFNEMIFIAFAFLIINFIKRNSFSLTEEYERILVVIYCVWLATSCFTRKFDFKNCRSFVYFITPYIKSFFLMAGLMALIVFSFRLFYYSRIQVFGTLLLLVLYEIFYTTLYYIDISHVNGAALGQKKFGKYLPTPRSTVAEDEESQSETGNGRTCKIVSVQKLKAHECALARFVLSKMEIFKLKNNEVLVCNSPALPELNGEYKSARLLANMFRLNDIRRINKYFLSAHRTIKSNAFLVGAFESLDDYRNNFLRKYPKRIAFVLYCFDFVLNRIIPKLPHLRQIYFAITKGKNRIISRAEVMGRLHYCGFKVIDMTKVDGQFCFLAQKVKRPVYYKSPTYGPLIQVERIGLDGNVIEILKLRTMHPYSEFVQEYVYEKNKLAPNGKINNDFRVSGYGRFFRKYWIDELPQIINYLRGDLSLIGVRALSQHYFSLYPKDLQELRIKFKPGLIPPYYADMPRSLDEIIDSERKYLTEKLKKPITTDFKYLVKAVYNICFKKARSL